VVSGRADGQLVAPQPGIEHLLEFAGQEWPFEQVQRGSVGSVLKGLSFQDFFLLRFLQVGHVIVRNHPDFVTFVIVRPHSVVLMPFHKLRDFSTWMTSLPTSAALDGVHDATGAVRVALVRVAAAAGALGVAVRRPAAGGAAALPVGHDGDVVALRHDQFAFQPE
jgi:hypothetical protein